MRSNPSRSATSSALACLQNTWFSKNEPTVRCFAFFGNDIVVPSTRKTWIMYHKKNAQIKADVRRRCSLGDGGRGGERGKFFLVWTKMMRQNVQRCVERKPPGHSFVFMLFLPETRPFLLKLIDFCWWNISQRVLNERRVFGPYRQQSLAQKWAKPQKESYIDTPFTFVFSPTLQFGLRFFLVGEPPRKTNL